jgi:hypothetical protein
MNKEQSKRPYNGFIKKLKRDDATTDIPNGPGKNCQAPESDENGDVIMAGERSSEEQKKPKKEGFVQAPWKLLRAKDLSLVDKVVLSVLAAFSLLPLSKEYGYVFLSNKTISDLICVSTNTVSSSIQRLKDSGLIRIENPKGARKIFLEADEIFGYQYQNSGS